MRYFAGLADQHGAGRLSLDDIRSELDARSSREFSFPRLSRACSTGDGTLFEFEDSRFLLRASGTDALLRYYIESTDAESFEALGKALIDLKITEGA